MSSEMKLTEQIKTCRTPQEALLLLAEAIDALQQTAAPADPWAGWLQADANREFGDSKLHAAVAAPAPDNRTEVVGNDIVAPPPTEERMLQRQLFARNIELHTFLGSGWTEDAAAETYAKGGGHWLYYDGGRDAIMAMPFWARQRICADIAEDSPTEGREVARDLLKEQKSVDMTTAVESLKRMTDGEA